MRILTSERLAKVLEQEELMNMAARARTGYYDEYRSQLATPTAQLVLDLFTVKRDDLARRAMNGEWKGTREECLAWWRAQPMF